MHKPLLAILAGYVLLVALYSGLIPPFEGPDGPQHWAYVAWLAEGKGLPPQGEAALETPVQQEASQPPLYYWLASLPARAVGVSHPPALFRPNPYFPSAAPGTVADNKNVAIHYPADLRPLKGGWLALYLARGLSLAFGVVLLASVYGLSREVAPNRPQIATLATLVVALNPQVLFLSGIVSNDVAAAATGGLTLWCMARLMRRNRPATGPAWATGIAFGLAALSKTSALALALPLAAGWIWMWFARPDHRRDLIRAGLAIGLSAGVVAGWWYARSWVLYGTPLGLNAHFQMPWALPAGAPQPAPTATWLEVFYSLWAAFGWGNIKFPGWAYLPAFAMVAATGVGLVLLSVRHRRAAREVHASAAITVVLALTVLGVAAALAGWMQRVRAPHGRLLFPALAALSLLLVIGWRALPRGVGWTGIGYLAVLALASPVFLIRPAYARPETMVEPDQPPLGWRFGEIAELVSVTSLARSAGAGDTLPVQVCWRPLLQAEKDYSVLVHLVGPEDRIVAARHTYPGLGSYPTSVWEPGRPFCDVIRLDVTPDLAQTLVYRIEVGLLDGTTGQRLPARSAAGDPLGSTFASAVRLVAAENPQPAPELVGDDPILLADYQFDARWRPGEGHDLLLTWFAARPVDRDYTVMIHLRRPADGQNVAVGDGPPLENWYPTSWWEAGEIVEDRHVFTLPLDIEPGRYRLVVGWYDPLTGERLGAEHLLGDVEVGS
jgi:4-amino-4-deoxy-L-arabinose transferase-like glycosyltransferase